MIDRLTYWNARRDGGKPTWSDNAPQDGFYRLRRSKDGPWLPVAIYLVEDGKEVAQVVVVDSKLSEDPNRDWRSCAERDISYEAYTDRVTTGVWCGEEPERPGSNMGPVEELDARITKDKEWLDGKPKLASRLDADEAANRMGKLRGLRKTVDDIHEEEKAPHLKAGRDVDAKYLPTIKRADPVLVALQRRIDAFDADERAKAAKEAEAAAAAKRAEADAQFLRGELPPVPVTPPAAAPPPARYGTGIGRAVKAKALPAVVKIIDQDAVYQFHRDDPELVALLTKFAQRCADAKVTCPGIEVLPESKGVAA